MVQEGSAVQGHHVISGRAEGRAHIWPSSFRSPTTDSRAASPAQEPLPSWDGMLPGALRWATFFWTERNCPRKGRTRWRKKNVFNCRWIPQWPLAGLLAPAAWPLSWTHAQDSLSLPYFFFSSFTSFYEIFVNLWTQSSKEVKSLHKCIQLTKTCRYSFKF